jgi:transposase
MTGKHYPSDLTDSQWDFIKDHFVPDPKKGGRPPKHSRRRILEAALYVLKTGCQWRYLPSDFPHWNTVYNQYRRWMQRGIIDQAGVCQVASRSGRDMRV